MRIDSHQHFWRYSAEDYSWIEKGSVLERDYGPLDLQEHLTANGLDGCVAVQARQNLIENEFLCKLADSNPVIRGVVGWIDLRSDQVVQQAEAFKQHPKAVGVRHVVQDEADPEFMAREAFRRGIASLASLNLVYDILIFEHQLEDAIRLVEAFPNQQFVLDHIAKPKIREGSIDLWKKRMRTLARSQNVAVKLSGIVTEANHKNWSEAELRPYWDCVLELFGADRMMFGSDWPVIRLACEYDRWVSVVQAWTARLSTTEQAWIWGQNAQRVYRL